MQVDSFPYPTAPQAAGLREAQQCLVALGAMEPGTGALTELGRALAGYPISPRHARMILEVFISTECIYLYLSLEYLSQSLISMIISLSA